jgi:16S rRNA (uracil1498-N3)-methyltransferase
MTLPFFWHPSVAQHGRGDTVRLAGEEGRHAVVVRRVRTGEAVVLTDGTGTSAKVRVVAVHRTELEALVESVTTTSPELPRVAVAQAVAKGDRGELAVQMLTEIGVDEIVPWAAARSVAVWRGERGAKALTRWRSTAREAAKQSRRAWFPTVAEPATTEQVASQLQEASVPVVLHESASGPLADLPVPGRGRIVVVVGPEGGITEDELAAFAAVGAEPVRLGSSVLRTSTAGVAAVAALLSRTPRWRSTGP